MNLRILKYIARKTEKVALVKIDVRHASASKVSNIAIDFLNFEASVFRLVVNI